MAAPVLASEVRPKAGTERLPQHRARRMSGSMVTFQARQRLQGGGDIPRAGLES